MGSNVHHIEFLRGSAATGETVGEGWFPAKFPRGICQLLSTLMPVLHLGSTDQDQEQMRYTFPMHHGTRELQALGAILQQRHDQWIRALMRYSPMSHAVLVGAGVDPVIYEGAIVAEDVGNDVDDQDIPSVDA